MATDSTAMTIDFLRARLLSERSVSRAARERADQLAQRVVELEEQLRIVSTQRKKAEKATAEVLAILESHGVDYFTEPEGIDSSSDQDEVEGSGPTTSAAKECQCDDNSLNSNSNSNSKGKDETSKSNESRAARSEVEDAMSGSEVDGQVVAGGLSWKGRSKSPDSNKKHRAAKHLRQIRPRNIFYYTSPDPSPKYQMGKSCRKIKPKDLRSETQDVGVKGCLDGNDKGGEIYKTEDEETGFYVEVSRECNETRRDADENDGQMERALEEQAQLIDQFQAEENAQREWEMMYSQNRNVPKDGFDLENKACISESIRQDKEEIADNRSSKTESEVEANAGPEILSGTEYASMTTEAQESTDATYEKAILALSDDNMHENATSIEDVLLMEINGCETEVPKQVKPFHDDPFADTTNESSDYGEVMVHNQQHFSSDKDSGSTNDSDLVDQTDNKVNVSIPNSPSSRSSRSNSSQTHEENPLALQLYEPPPESCNKSSCSAVEDVLESLRRAKMSLRENLIKKLPLHEQQLLAITDRPHDQEQQLLAITDRPHEEMDSRLTMRCSELLVTHSVNIPVGSSSGLFRLPTDSFPKSGISENFLSLEYSGNLPNRLPMNSSGAATDDYLRTQLLLDLPGAFSGSSRHAFGSSSNLTSETASSFPTRIPRFYEDFRTALPAGDRLFSYGGDSSFSNRRML